MASQVRRGRIRVRYNRVGRRTRITVSGPVRGKPHRPQHFIGTRTVRNPYDRVIHKDVSALSRASYALHPIQHEFDVPRSRDEARRILRWFDGRYRAKDVRGRAYRDIFRAIPRGARRGEKFTVRLSFRSSQYLFQATRDSFAKRFFQALGYSKLSTLEKARWYAGESGRVLVARLLQLGLGEVPKDFNERQRLLDRAGYEQAPFRLEVFR